MWAALPATLSPPDFSGFLANGVLVLWPRGDGDLSEFMRWLTVTHTQRWHAAHGTAGTGPLYQGRFKSFPIQEDDHLWAVLRYVERNALRANHGKSERPNN